MSTIVITGIAGTIGRLLARQLHLDHEVMGLDRRDLEGKPKDIKVFSYDIRRKRCEKVFRNNRVDVIYHLNIMHDFNRPQAELHSFNVVGTQRVLEYAAKYNVKKVVFLSTANVYGARPDNPQYLTEDSLLLAGETFSAMRSLITADMLVTSFFWKNPEIETVILRPAHILGTVRNAPTLYLSLSRVPTLLGFDPMIQLIHESEVVRALVLVLKAGARGIFNVAGPPAAPLSSILHYLQKPRIPVPHALLKKVARQALQFGMANVPPAEVDFIRYPCLVDDARARSELGFEPRYNLTETLDLLRESPVYLNPQFLPQA